MLKLKDPIVVLEDGTELQLPCEFERPADIGKAVVRAIFNHYLSSGLATTRCYNKTAEICGFDASSSVYRVLK